MRTPIKKDAMFQPVRYASEITGLSAKSIRAGCRAGIIPHIRVGHDYRINMTSWLEMLEAASRTHEKGGTNEQVERFNYPAGNDGLYGCR